MIVHAFFLFSVTIDEKTMVVQPVRFPARMHGHKHNKKEVQTRFVNASSTGPGFDFH
jgi:hypothetical protein